MVNTNIGAYITSRLAMDNITYGAGAAAPALTAGNALDRQAAGLPTHLSGKAQFGYKATLASGHTASATFALQHADSEGGQYADIEGASGSVSLTALDSGAAQRGVAELDVNLIGAKEFVKTRFTPVMSHSGTDTIAVAGVLALGGGETAPAI